ncbi:MAG: AAA family ATPase [Gammaproteobacteria bacterium]|nr:AAA family ATPase [Gammaproteobacteria bacterium]MXW44414.1 AAA domain-containing protein [Gammaproteobacteria bacterium]MYD02597.1 AAA domain-containing protein [Gammaproteobacteria bacterium]MYI26195.1 AAA domain-containing protein [Gammaproteobacteria bacterium]
MANLDLKTGEGLLQACNRAEADIDPADIDKVAQFLERVQSTAPEDRSGESFVRLVWEQNPLDGLGHGDYSLENAYTDAGFRDDFAKAVNQTLPQEGQQRLEAINGLVDQTGELAKKFVKANKSGEQQVPMAKTLRALTALFPFDLTPPTYAVTLKKLTIAMDLTSRTSKYTYGKYAEKSREIIDRLDGVLGPLPKSDWTALATRRQLARSLGNLCSESAPAQEAELKPLPASDRRKGLVAFGGLWERLLRVVEYVNNKPTKDELRNFMREGYPAKKDGSISTEINSIEKEFNAIEAWENRYSLTDTGRKLLETRSPDAVRDWLLTRILGPDHVLVALGKGVCTKQDVTELLQRVNPGWTTKFAPDQMLSWLRALSVVELDPSGNLVLTESGRRWESLIHWEPEYLEKPPDDNALPPISTLEELARELNLPVDFLQNIETLLEEKKQVIFQGPPGTGKTFVAQKFARHLAGAKDRCELVQFHPSYSYEDFVRGYRPTLLDQGQAGFELKDGPFLRIARQAEQDPDRNYFLIIDEINRGNLAKVLGELYFLLEYRKEAVNLMYQEDEEHPFKMPPNLYIIGTMNTADRSIALVDLALRRRFAFVDFATNTEPVKGLLSRWLEANNLAGMDWVADIVERANEKLDDHHAAIGPSYFMRRKLDDAAVERIWKHAVLPYVEEHLFGQRDRLGEFALDALRGMSAPKGREAGNGGDLQDAGEGNDA